MYLTYSKNYPNHFEMLNTLLIINQTEAVHVINQQNIVYCQAFDGYCEVYTLDGKRIMISKTLTKISEQLDGMFIQVSQSKVVNRLYILKILKKEKKIILVCGQEISFTIKIKNLMNLLSKSEITR